VPPPRKRLPKIKIIKRKERKKKMREEERRNKGENNGGKKEKSEERKKCWEGGRTEGEIFSTIKKGNGDIVYEQS